jgi:hypothetical protein
MAAVINASIAARVAAPKVRIEFASRRSCARPARVSGEDIASCALRAKSSSRCGERI